jgi:hypothetical protein
MRNRITYTLVQSLAHHLRKQNLWWRLVCYIPILLHSWGCLFKFCFASKFFIQNLLHKLDSSNHNSGISKQACVFLFLFTFWCWPQQLEENINYRDKQADTLSLELEESALQRWQGMNVFKVFKAGCNRGVWRLIISNAHLAAYEWIDYWINWIFKTLVSYSTQLFLTRRIVE